MAIRWRHGRDAERVTSRVEQDKPPLIRLVISADGARFDRAGRSNFKISVRGRSQIQMHDR